MHTQRACRPKSIWAIRRGACAATGTLDEIVSAHPHLAGRSLEDVFLALTGADEEAAPV